MNRHLLALILLSFSCSALAELTIKDGYVRGLPPGQPNTAAFMRLVNSGDQDVVITAADSNGAELAEVHSHKHQNGMMSMEKVDQVTVPAKGEFVLAPGKYHLMLIRLTKPLREGDEVEVRLLNGDVELTRATLPVRSVLNER
ncbi:hypothetical protein BST96_05040 [Oceanicoccus sagamiensis]|uniref:Copper chaperone PCu(A)C n=1 Tax=Oceanicoccus sagamiensis TaxID=716816 RepID=A0A1X9NIV2_9GAMM|nr:hypothetical protein BST96_05040 [Oceanicoccus sagamiensis]